VHQAPGVFPGPFLQRYRRSVEQDVISRPTIVRGADLLAQAIAEHGIDTVFTLSGNQIMPLFDACIEPGLRLVHTRHEGAAVFMADAWAQLNNKPGVALVPAAPGFANALGALYSASMAESPVIFLSGDSPIASDGKGSFQAFPQTAAAAPFVKHSERAMDASTLRDAWQRCAAIAIHGRPGPVHLALPFDVLNADVGTTSDADASTSAVTGASLANLTPDSDDITQVLKILEGATRPLILTGPAASRTRCGKLLDRLQRQHKVPIVSMESPRGLNDPSLGQIKDIIRTSDCLLLLGKKVDYTLALGHAESLPARQIIVIDPDAADLARSREALGDRCVLALLAGTLETMSALLQRNSKQPERTGWSDLVERKIMARVESSERHSDDTLLPAQLMSIVDKAVRYADDAIVVCDGGEFGQWAQAGISALPRLINGPAGAIGGSLPYAIAASIARPNATVFCLLGDGTVGFHIGEFETASREAARLVVIIGNDSRWNAEHQIQLRDFGESRTHSCSLGKDVRYDLAAIGLGTKGAFVTSAAELTRALELATENANLEQTTCINVRLAGLPAPTH